MESTGLIACQCSPCVPGILNGGMLAPFPSYAFANENPFFSCRLAAQAHWVRELLAPPDFLQPRPIRGNRQHRMSICVHVSMVQQKPAIRKLCHGGFIAVHYTRILRQYAGTPYVSLIVAENAPRRRGSMGTGHAGSFTTKKACRRSSRLCFFDRHAVIVFLCPPDTLRRGPYRYPGSQTFRKPWYCLPSAGGRFH